MSESDGIDDVLDSGLRQSLLIASRTAKPLACRRHEAQARLTAERCAARAALAPVEKDQLWDEAQACDIATAHAVADGWNDQDLIALAASERIRHEVLTRYGINSHDVGADAAKRQPAIETIATEKTRPDELASSQEAIRKAAAEHEMDMQLLAAVCAAELCTQAAILAPETERHQMLVEYLANLEFAQALQQARYAKTPNAVADADIVIKERMLLIAKDTTNGPDAEQLRNETMAYVNDAHDSHFDDPEFVKAAKDMYEAKILAEGGFKCAQFAFLKQRYERAEMELSARLEGVGREIENCVTGNDSGQFKDRGPKAETASSTDCGSAADHEKLARSLENGGASETQIRGRIAAARSGGTHPGAAVTMDNGATDGTPHKWFQVRTLRKRFLS